VLCVAVAAEKVPWEVAKQPPCATIPFAPAMLSVSTDL
jgi:hypothetical protein